MTKRKYNYNAHGKGGMSQQFYPDKKPNERLRPTEQGIDDGGVFRFLALLIIAFLIAYFSKFL